MKTYNGNLDFWHDLCAFIRVNQTTIAHIRDINAMRLSTSYILFWMMQRKHKYWISIRIILLPILIFLFIDSFGQDNSNDKILRNEIGINFFSYLPSPEYNRFLMRINFIVPLFGGSTINAILTIMQLRSHLIIDRSMKPRIILKIGLVKEHIKRVL